MTDLINNTNKSSPKPRAIWITVEAAEIIELKRIKMDKDAAGAVVYFREVLLPRVIEHCIALDQLEETNSNE
jgi:hypothetical protein